MDLLVEERESVVKPVNVWESIMWVAAAVSLVCAVITFLVQDSPNAAWVLFIVALVILIASGGERRRVQRGNR